MNSPDRYDTSEQIKKNFAAWRIAMETSHAVLMAGLRIQVGPEGDVDAAYRQWQIQRRKRKLRDYEKAYQRHVRRSTQKKDQLGGCESNLP